jgi:thioredoxin 1
MSYTELYARPEPARAEVDAWPGITVLEFGAPWCGHCIGAQRAIAAAIARAGTLRHLKIEDGRGLALGRSYRVKLWPTLVVLRDGVEVARVVRPQQPAEIAQVLALARGDAVA